MALKIKLHEASMAYSPSTKKLGGHVWSLENLNVDDGEGGIVYNPRNGEYYYNQWAARRVAKSIPGWHLPSKQEFEDLADYLSYENLDDDNFTVHEFNIKLVGESDTIGKSPTFEGIGETASFWTAATNVEADLLDEPQEIVVGKNRDTFGDNMYRALSIRLVKD